MKLLVVGGGGFVGRVVRPVLEHDHECMYYDLHPVEGTRCPTIVADVNDDARVADAVRDVEAVIYMPLGTVGGNVRTCMNVDAAFDVNVKGLYRFLDRALSTGVPWFCYISTLSVYHDPWAIRPAPLCERIPPDATHTYGMSKRAGELLCQAYAAQYPAAMVMSLRLCTPVDDEGWRRWREQQAAGATPRPNIPLGPESHRRLFAAMLRFHRPGYHLIHATGDTTGRRFDGTVARQLLSWEPHDG